MTWLVKDFCVARVGFISEYKTYDGRDGSIQAALFYCLKKWLVVKWLFGMELIGKGLFAMGLSAEKRFFEFKAMEN